MVTNHKHAGLGRALGGGVLSAQRGRRLAEQRGCLTCHSTDGAKGVGPSWQAGTEVELSDGRKIPRDRDYLARAILDPDAEITAGYAKGVMTGAMPGRKLTEPEVEALVLYLLFARNRSPDRSACAPQNGAVHTLRLNAKPVRQARQHFVVHRVGRDIGAVGPNHDARLDPSLGKEGGIRKGHGYTH